jgi:hypothetical protein
LFDIEQKQMTQHSHELPLRNKDDEMPISGINNGPSDVGCRPEILSNTGTNRNINHSVGRNSFNRSPNKEILKNISNELKELNRELMELCKTFKQGQFLTLGVIVSAYNKI